jgi:hypothetical protein
MNSIKQLFKVKWVLIPGIIIFALSAYKKENRQKEDKNKFSFMATNRYDNDLKVIINVSNVDELYAAVNNAANAGARIVLAANTYILDPNHANGGRLELQKDMELRGQPGAPEQVKIDESGLPVASFVPPALPGAPKKTGGIRIGRGFNSIEWLTVIGNSGFDPSAKPKTPFALSAIDTDLDSDSTHVRLAHLVVKNCSQIGIDIRNGGGTSSGRFIEADIFDNEIFDNKSVVNLDASGNGITIQNSVGATGAVIFANLVGNYVHDNNTGLRSHNQHSNSARITIQSTADRFDKNGIGIILNAGLDINPATIMTSANLNFLSFEAHGSSFRNNKNNLPPDAPPLCGIYAAGGVTSQVGNRASNNILTMKLSGCFISGNQGTDDINVFGARSPSGGLAGTNNLVTVQLNGITKTAKIKTVASDPSELAVKTNIVNVF